ncbi:MAG: PAS domain-containing protein [Deltaproteobacteria bacterium]|nr:PAS domain-containing protein [Deltaproteobacteria bacterium]
MPARKRPKDAKSEPDTPEAGAPDTDTPESGAPDTDTPDTDTPEAAAAKKKPAPRRKRKSAEEKEPASQAGGSGDGEPAEPPLPKEPMPPGFPVVGIGASAGGLEALQEFLQNLPSDADLALVVIMHQDPRGKSHLVPILQRVTTLPVSEIAEGQKPQAGHVQVCPPGKLTTLAGGEFHVRDQADIHAVGLDVLFSSLAAELETNSAGIVLSGSGSDGARGVKDIKAAGGLVMIQDESTARYADMPRAARATGVADFIAAPGDMPLELKRYFSLAQRLRESPEDRESQFDKAAGKIFQYLRQATHHDFSMYKASTMRRRVERRMSLQQMVDFNRYAALLARDKSEARALFQELLIGVTSFFRDPEAFEALKERALKPQLSQFRSGQKYRVWIPGCSTGEEAYSVGMLLWECLEELDLDLNLQIFGTDIDPQAVKRAREGEYPVSIAVEVRPERLRRFFRLEHESFRVRKELRDSIVFSEQDVLKDPPFSRLNLLVCRNLLIYLKNEAQQNLLPLFHYTLLQGGLLFLGSSESLGRQPELFEALDPKWKIFRKRESASALQPRVTFPASWRYGGREYAPTPALPVKAELIMPREVLIRQAKEALLEVVLPAALLVDAEGEILYVHGRTGKYLEPAPGPSRMNVMQMAREGLKAELGFILPLAANQGRPRTARRVAVKTNGGFQVIDLSVHPLKLGSGGSEIYAILFEDVDQKARTTPPKPSEADTPDVLDRSHLQELENELQATRESHQTTIEELESSNEELKSTNEEMQSTNEELQSTNEELESSREELQSVNEELSTVNNELRSKIEELSRTQESMTNLLNSTRVAILFLGRDLTIRRFTPECEKIINLIPSDVGRPVEHLSTKLEYPGLVDDARQVLATLQTLEREVRTKSEEWYQMRVMPFRTTNSVIDGVVITFNNISAHKKSQDRLALSREFSRDILDTLPTPLVVLDGKLVVVLANRSFRAWFGKNVPEIEGRYLRNLGNGEWDAPGLGEKLEAVLRTGTGFADFELENSLPRPGRNRVTLAAHPMNTEPGSMGRILLTGQVHGSQDGESKDI